MEEIYDYENNCSMVAFQQILPDRNPQDIIRACIQAGFTEENGMLPQQIHQAAKLLKLKFVSVSSRRPNTTYKSYDMRGNMTLQQALDMTKDKVCLIRVSGHVLASNRGIPLDPNVARRGARRRVLEIIVIDNATIARRDPTAISDDPLLMFDRDLRDETQKRSARMKIYERIFNKLNVTDVPISFSELRKLGYTRRMMLRHYSRGEVHVIQK